MPEQPCHRFSAMPLMDWSYQILGSVEMDLRSTSTPARTSMFTRPGRRPQGWVTVEVWSRSSDTRTRSGP